MPKISVIIPNYNHARFLEQRIQSVLEQTYQDFEIIYLDDASTDNSNGVFAKFADNPRIRAIYNQTNSGSPFKQWNKGVRHANGEYIWIAESDDYAEPVLLERLVEKLDQHPSVGLAYCQSRQVDENNNVNSTYHWFTDDTDTQRWIKNFINTGVDECRNYLIFKNTIPNASAVLFRRSLYNRFGGADETMILCGDWLVWVKILLISDITFIAEPLNYFRTHSGTVRVKSERMSYAINEYLHVMNFIAANLEVSHESLTRASHIMLERWAGYLTAKIASNVSLKQEVSIYRGLLQLNPSVRFQISVYKKIIMIFIAFIRYRAGLGTKLKTIKNYLRYQ